MLHSAYLDPGPLEDKITTLLSERILETGDDFTPETNLFDAGLDSMAIMQFLIVLEEEFGVSIPVESVSRQHFSSVHCVAALMRDKLGLPALPSSPAIEVPPPCAAAPKPKTAPAPDVPVLFEKLPLKGCDYFVLSFDSMSRRTGQGGHKAHSFLELSAVPDVAKLRAALERATDLFPMLSARLGRRGLFGRPFWYAVSEKAVTPLLLFCETGSPGALKPFEAQDCLDAHALMERIVNTPLPPQPASGPWSKARFNLIERKDGTAVLVFSWSHLMIDGVGAEAFLCELLRLAGEPVNDLPAVNPVDLPDPKAPPNGWAERWETARPIIQFFRSLGSKAIACLGSIKPRPGNTHFFVHTLTEEQTRTANNRCNALCGGIVNMPFYLACAMRAHDRVFAHRGQSPAVQMCSVPVQTRRKGVRGPVFLNHVTMFFGLMERTAAGSIESATASLMEQHTRFLKDKLGESLNDLMYSMSLIPPGLYMRFVKMQMRGPFASFFHSHTGEFAPGLNNFLGGKVQNTFHVPGIASPPGTGIFCNEKNGRLVITLCWHEDALTAEERTLMLNQYLTDLGV